ncbi:helix-turn-helix domain-containing protein [Chromobacterium sp. IIBBL 290-4]|uniref:winged helix-turn-helix transcriptional regulator n=1 Tax=Chromobacterium sp. IIBBL 290-4 TaxID=2953890 RepID=UPI0020B7A24A|nr:helix-turn-helix domain-containing protein [Chromobacterium sp. IIBBL 290-4]UTH73692.1 helix-turn-helix transcriptional regulator [Chromobacterium sp. IIBBL 290-4]
MLQFVGLISGKWAVPVLYRLIMQGGPIRFNELQRAIGSITQKELTKQLRLLERRGLLSREVYPEMPPRVEYQITPLGATLGAPLQSLADWMRRHGAALGA